MIAAGRLLGAREGLRPADIVMIKTPAKSWKSIDEQIKILHDRGIIIDDESRAALFLSRVGYYRLSGYWYPFRQFGSDRKRTDNFIDGTSFENVVGLYLFDRKLRLLALDAIERIELAVQVQVAHILGERDPMAHLNSSELHGNFTKKTRHWDGLTDHQRWLASYEKLKGRASKKEFVRHNISKYGELPVWVAIEVFDFGCLSKLYAGLQVADKLTIETQFGLNTGHEFQTWLRSLNFIRNTSAHHSRLWNANILDTAKIPQQKVQLKKLNITRPFLYFCIMQTIMKIVSPNSKWNQRFIDLLSEFPTIENGAVTLADMGVVDSWQEWALWR